MKDTFNIVKVSGDMFGDDNPNGVNCEIIIKKCIAKPNMINYYYPHVFMNRDTIDKQKIISLFSDHIINIKREKALEHTFKKYNILNSILESLFLCVLDIKDIKDLNKLLQFNLANDANIICDLLNNIIENKSLFNLEQLLNDKIDNSHCIFIIEKLMLHVHNNYNDENIEIKTLNNYHLFNTIGNYLLKIKYNPFIVKVINCNKIELLHKYINVCVINDSHDTYINNIILMYDDILKGINPNEQINNINWQTYFDKIEASLNITNQKEKIMKSILRLTVLDKISNITIKYFNNSNRKTIIDIIEKNKLEKIIINNYVNLIKNNTSFEKLSVFENILKYFNNLGSLSKELIKIIMPKYFYKQNIKYYTDIILRLNSLCGNKLDVIDKIIENQRLISNDLKITTVTNESNGMFNIEDICLYNIDQKLSSFPEVDILKYTKELNSYAVFTTRWFDNHFNKFKNTKINGLLSNGSIQMNNTIINSNLVIINTLFMFNESSSILISNLSNYLSNDIIDDIINTLEYYNIISVNGESINLITSFFEKKQTIQIDIIKKVNFSEVTKDDLVKNSENITIENYDLIECYILKSIKTEKIHKDSLFDIVEKKVNLKTIYNKTIFDKCMKRLLELDYYEIQDDLIIYVP